jgi:hypothetical protein
MYKNSSRRVPHVVRDMYVGTRKGRKIEDLDAGLGTRDLKISG